MEKMKVFLSSVLAGVCIAIGGMAYLSCDNKVLGAFFFVVGLFTICTFKLDLFTGKVCYVFERDKSYAYKLPIIWTGNLVGTWVAAQLHLLTRYGEALREKAKALGFILVMSLGNSVGATVVPVAERIFAKGLHTQQ